ncbi:MAG: thymidine phosphorylase [Kiritimatiellaeota bacterium]|nr:thymidine phosphorylase [Kiritimatiellota bacterium]
MIPQFIIEQKRDGKELAPDDIRVFINEYANGSLPDYQMAAFAMAVYFKGMTAAETATLTDAMMHSGDVLDFSDLPRPTVDKHSTGGVGDKISIPLAPLVAVCGAAVPMISGRGLGITGGTLDKLESIPGYDTSPTTDRFREILASVGCSIIGQTVRLAPADKKLYALRDVTATVPSIPLICASIMSKKLAEGAAALVLDVKCGAGAFMKTLPEARELAKNLVAIGRNMGRSVSALITAMDEPLGATAGNRLEIIESIEVLKGRGPADVIELTLRLAAEMLVCSGGAVRRRRTARPPLQEALKLAKEKLADGSALETFAAMLRAHGGDTRIIDDYDLMKPAPFVTDVTSKKSVYITKVDADIIGRVVLMLGGGRTKATDIIDHSVGIDSLAKVGTKIAKGDLLLRIHAKNENDANAVLPHIRKAFLFAETAPSATPLVIESVG